MWVWPIERPFGPSGVECDHTFLRWQQSKELLNRILSRTWSTCARARRELVMVDRTVLVDDGEIATIDRDDVIDAASRAGGVEPHLLR